jgi:hypothetical protein
MSFPLLFEGATRFSCRRTQNKIAKENTRFRPMKSLLFLLLLILGGWTGLTPDDSPLLLRNVGSEEIYALDWEAP